MKKLLTLILLTFSLNAFSQTGTPISATPTFLGNCDSCFVLAVLKVGNTYINRKVYGKDLSKVRVDSIRTALSNYSLSSHVHTFASLTSRPTTLAGYGITDAITQTVATASFAPIAHIHATADVTSGIFSAARLGGNTPTAQKFLRGNSIWDMVDWSDLTSKPTTLAGLGITDTASLASSRDFKKIGDTLFLNQLKIITTLNFPSTAAQTSSDLTVMLTGVALGDIVTMGVPSVSVEANSSYTSWVSASNTITVRLNNYSASSIDPASGNFNIIVTKQ